MPDIRVTVAVEGLKELDHALAQLSKPTARNTLLRVLRLAGEPIAADAVALAPVGPTGRLKRGIQVSTRIANNVGRKEFAQAMAAGLGREAAVGALRLARRTAPGKSFAELYVGPRRLPYSHLVEFGSVHNTPKPFMRPAWDSKKETALQIIKNELGNEIKKSAARVAKRAAKILSKV